MEDGTETSKKDAACVGRIERKVFQLMTPKETFDELVARKLPDFLERSEVAIGRLEKTSEEWFDMGGVPTDRPVLVFMPKEMQGSHVHAARYRPKGEGATTIGNHFIWDAVSAYGEPIGWIEQPPAPKRIVRT